MKPITFFAHRVLLASFAALLFVVIAAGSANAQTNAFTFQGRLNDTSLPASGTYTMKFVLYDDPAKGNQIGSAQTSLVTVTNGIFTTVLDFGETPFVDGQALWMEVIVNTINLSPRQQVTSAPYAIRTKGAARADSMSAACTLCITDAHISGIAGSKVTGSVANATNAGTALDSLNLGGVPASGYLPTTGGTVTGSLNVGGVLSGDGSGLTNLPGAGFIWQEILGPAYLAQPNHGYVANFAAPVTITLPTTINVGDTVRVSGAGTGGWKIAQNAGQRILTPNFTAVGNWTDNKNWGAVASSSDGTKLVAVVNGGFIYTSTDSGASWVGRESSRAWTAVASSADGTKLVAGVAGGFIYTSIDSGLTWTQRFVSAQTRALASSADGVKLVAVIFGNIYTSIDSGVTWTLRSTFQDWQGVASSDDGTKLVAAGTNSQIYTSTDSGVTWTPRDSARQWWSIASSSNGNKLFAGSGQIGTGGDQLYTSTDSGLTWTPRRPGVYHGVASSADGTKLVTGYTPGSIYTSTDSGVTWTSRDSIRNWWSFASSADGVKLVGVVQNGLIYRSSDSGLTWTTTSPKGTSYGTDGYITGVQYSAVELQYIGGGNFMVLSSYGTQPIVN